MMSYRMQLDTTHTNSNVRGEQLWLTSNINIEKVFFKIKKLVQSLL